MTKLVVCRLLRRPDTYITQSQCQQEAQLMLTNLRDAFIGQSRSPNIVPFHILGMISYCVIVTIGLSRTISKINGDFRQKLPIFLTRVFNAPAEGVPFGIRYRRRGQMKLE